MMRLTSKTLLFAALLTWSCKNNNISRVSEQSGGTKVTWKTTATLYANGDLRIERTDSGRRETENKFTTVALMASKTPYGRIPSRRVTKGKWIALADEQTRDATYDLLFTTAKDDCYVNDSSLDGEQKDAYCMQGNTQNLTDAQVNVKLQKETCRRLSTTYIPSTAVIPSKDYAPTPFAKFDANSASCVCLNGGEREIRYDEQSGKASREAAQIFEANCRKRGDVKIAGPATAEDKNYNTCVDLYTLAYWRLDRSNLIDPGLTACVCGVEKLDYGDAKLNGDGDAFEKQCRKAAQLPDGLPTSEPTDGSTDTPPPPVPVTPTDRAGLTKQMQAACESMYYVKDSYCDCSAKGSDLRTPKTFEEYETFAAFLAAMNGLVCD